MVIDPLTRERGCDRCADPIVTKVESKAGTVELCLSHTMAWFPGRDAAWFEERHAPFQDHLAEKMRLSAENERKRWAERLLRDS